MNSSVSSRAWVGGLAGIAELQALGHARRAGRNNRPAAAHILLDQAHAARAQRVQLGMRAEDRDVDIGGLFGRVGQQHPVGDFVFDVVDGDGYEIRHNAVFVEVQKVDELRCLTVCASL